MASVRRLDGRGLRPRTHRLFPPRAPCEVVSIYNNRKHMFKDSIVSQNELFAEDFPREYQTWANTTDTTYKGEFNSSQRSDVLAARPEMVVLWAGYSFSMEYNTPRG